MKNASIFTKTKNLLKIILIRINSINTSILVLAPTFFVLAVFYIGDWILRHFNLVLPDVYLDIFAIASMITLGLSGLAMIIKKELPPMNFLSIRGVPAITMGLMILIIWWGIACAILYMMIMRALFG